MKSLFTAALILFAATSSFAEEQAPAAAKLVDPAAVARVLTLSEQDVVLGKDDAPLTLIEYSSLSCSHCAHFHNEVLPTLKKEFIDTGKLRFINRDFALNAPALKGAMLAQCAPQPKRATFYKVLFELQSKWAFTPKFEEALQKIAAVGGIDADAFAACMKDTALEERLLAQRQAAEEALDIQGTPSFYLNGEKLALPLDAALFTEALNAKLAAQKP